MSETFTDTELGILHRLDLLDMEHQRCAVAPEHEADAMVGMLWEALGSAWRPKHYYASWSRSDQQTVARAHKRLRERKFIGRPEDDGDGFELFPGVMWSTTSRYWLTGRGQQVVKDTRLPSDLRRFCRADVCERWLMPTHREPMCRRCTSRPNRLTPSKSFRSRFGKAGEIYVSQGWADIALDHLLGDKDLADAMRLSMAGRKAMGHGLYELHGKIEKADGMIPHVGPLAKGLGNDLDGDRTRPLARQS